MFFKKIGIILWVSYCLLFHWSVSIGAQDLDYGLRYNYLREEYYEGTEARERTANAIELVCAMAGYPGSPPERLPERLGVKFYLERPAEVYLSVQELRYAHEYRLDKIFPFDRQIESPIWFEWPTQNVIWYLQNFNIYNLGIVARLNYQEPNVFLENVAPVIFYHSSQPGSVYREYVFIFRTVTDAEVHCRIYKEENGQLVPIKTICFAREATGEIWFPVFWDGLDAYGLEVEEGFYQLEITGEFWDDPNPFSQTVRFYHNFSDQQG